jgi:branched-subunit amino acid transport protein
MTSGSIVWQAVLLVGAGSYLMRLLPLLLTGRLAVPDRVALLLRDAGTAALTAVLVSAAGAVAQQRPGAEVVVLGGCLLVGGLLAYAGRSVVVVVAGGAAAYAVGLLTLSTLTAL